jgi:uncharacterized membrane protein YhaH (DUF805 family)
MSEKLITSDKLILGCGSFVLIGFVFLCIGDSAGDTATTIGGYCFLFGIISPLIVMALRGKINDAFYRPNPQSKIDIEEEDGNDISDNGGVAANGYLRELGAWSIIPLTLCAVAAFFIIKLLNRLDVSSFALYTWALLLPCLCIFVLFEYLFNEYINKESGDSCNKDLGNSTRSFEHCPDTLTMDPNNGEVKQSKSNDNNLESSERYVGPLKSFELFFKNYTEFTGRSSRSSFWWWQLFDWVLISTIVQVVDVTLHSSEVTDWFYHPDIGGVTSLLWFVVTLVPCIALTVRRLHDTNRSGWWLLLSVTVIGIIPLIIWFCSSGNRKKNTYGADKEAGL